MKHLLNDLSEFDKNRILEQYNNSLVVETKNFNRLIKSKSGNVRPLLVEKDELLGVPPSIPSQSPTTPTNGSPTPPSNGQPYDEEKNNQIQYGDPLRLKGKLINFYLDKGGSKHWGNLSITEIEYMTGYSSLRKRLMSLMSRVHNIGTRMTPTLILKTNQKTNIEDSEGFLTFTCDDENMGDKGLFRYFRDEKDTNDVITLRPVYNITLYEKISNYYCMTNQANKKVPWSDFGSVDNKQSMDVA